MAYSITPYALLLCIGLLGASLFLIYVRRPPASLKSENLPIETGLHQYIHQIPDYAFFMLDPNGCIVSWNAGAERLKGYASQEIIGRHFSVFYTPEDASIGKPQHALQTAASKGVYEEEGWRVRKDGSRFAAAVTLTALRDEKGRLCGFAKLTHDISERKHMENALRQSEERLRVLYDNAPIGIARFDMQGKCTFANKKFADIIGYSIEEAMRLDYLEVALPEEKEASAQFARKLANGEMDTISRERRLLRKDASTIWVRLTAKMMRDEAGQAECGIAVFEDITERKEIEEAFRESEERYREIFEHAPVGIAEGTLAGKLISTNPQLSKILGYSAEEMMQLSIQELTHPADLEQTRANLEKLIAGEIDSYFMEKRCIRKDRTIVWAMSPPRSGTRAATAILNM